MRKLTLSVLAVIFLFSFSTVFISCGDEEKTDETSSNAIETIDDAAETAVVDFSSGESIYAKTCLACHQANGEGIEGAFPSLKGKAVILSIIANGKEGTSMIAYKDQYSDQEIADVANYINHTWGNNFATVSAEDVAAVK